MISLLFTEVPRIGFLRTSPKRSSPKLRQPFYPFTLGTLINWLGGTLRGPAFS